MNIFSFDIILFVALTLIYYKLKSKYPDFFFPCKGISILFPPPEEHVNEWIKEKEKSLKKKTPWKKPQFIIPRILEGTSKNYENVVYRGELDIFIMLFIVCFIELALKELVLRPFFNITESNILFYMSLFVLCMAYSNLFSFSIIGGLKSYEVKIYAGIAILYTVFL